jgi:hypothetical protein
MLGIWVQRYPDLARAVVAAGNVVGDHSWNHPDLATMNAGQITRQLSNTRDIIQQVTGVTPYLFRPPYEDFNRQVLDTARQLDLSTIIWNVDPRDWARPGVGAITGNVLTFTQNGSVILMHDGGGDRSQTVAALSTIISRLQARGYTFVTIPQMVRHLTTSDDPQGIPHPPGVGPFWLIRSPAWKPRSLSRFGLEENGCDRGQTPPPFAARDGGATGITPACSASLRAGGGGV